MASRLYPSSRYWRSYTSRRTDLKHLQNHCATTNTQLFGQILVSFYQNDVIDEDDLKNWQRLPASRMGQVDSAENHKKFWVIGSRILQQLLEQDSEDESDEDGDEDDE
jgi:hypothetical protein